MDLALAPETALESVLNLGDAPLPNIGPALIGRADVENVRLAAQRTVLNKAWSAAVGGTRDWPQSICGPKWRKLVCTDNRHSNRRRIFCPPISSQAQRPAAAARWHAHWRLSAVRTVHFM